ncbi:hypothetical protein B0H63DRAFT_107286 [Podospora didyma]|uniref:Ribosomal protein S21 n=1 Tax=Podospora didyma TaxID=330526 RepID=A0AAE0NYL3_9PEZI|nr:hypothetical protein B0H63DRAFT_107286 [Podospora didyma]
MKSICRAGATRHSLLLAAPRQPTTTMTTVLLQIQKQQQQLQFSTSPRAFAAGDAPPIRNLEQFRNSIKALENGRQPMPKFASRLPPRPGPPSSGSQSSAAAILGSARGASASPSARKASEDQESISALVEKGAKSIDLTPWALEDFKHRSKQNEGTYRLRPSTGRTVNVERLGPAAALVSLDRLVKSNFVKVDEISQRFHERKALKTKRQRRERWRKRFKMGMKSTINRVMELRKQGW